VNRRGWEDLSGCPELTLHNIGGHERRCVVVALDGALRQVALHLQAEQVAGILLLQLRRVGRVELDAEAQECVHERQAHLPGKRLFQVQPVLPTEAPNSKLCFHEFPPFYSRFLDIVAK